MLESGRLMSCHVRDSTLASPPAMNPRTKNLIQLNTAVLIWGGTAMFAKGIALPVQNITCMRSFVAAAVLLLFVRCTGRSIGVKSSKHLGVMMGLGVLLCLHWLTYFQALKVSTAAVAILSLHTYPVLTAILEPFFFRGRLKKADVMLALGVFAGVLIMMPEISLSNSVTQGVLLGVLSGVFFMARNLITRKFAQDYSSATLMFWQSVVAGVVLIPVVFASPAVEYDSRSILLLGVLGVFFTALPHTLFSASFQNLSAKTVSILATLLPFYGAVFGYLIYQEQITGRILFGGSIVFICIIFETVISARDSNSGKESPLNN